MKMFGGGGGGGGPDKELLKLQQENLEASKKERQDLENQKAARKRAQAGKLSGRSGLLAYRGSDVGVPSKLGGGAASAAG